MYVIAVLSLKGGVGKTTLATNLAAAAHLRGKSTILVDLDKQGSSLDWGSMRSESSKLAGIAVSKHDRNFSRARLLELATGREVVVLDGPPRIGDQSSAAAIAADIVVIPVTPGPFDLWATDETLQELDRADALREQLGRGPVRRLFVANRCAARTVLTRSARDALGQRGQVSDTTIQQRVVYPESAATGESVLTTQPKGPAAAELQKLFDEIMPAPVAPASVPVAAAKKKRGKA
jgi:chromosome partitioning protein